MRLSDLSHFENIVIQCHDNPDPDAVASGFGLYRFFAADTRRHVRLVYAANIRYRSPTFL